MLRKHPDAEVSVVIVWLPVILSDTGPPADGVRAPLADPRVVEFWDPELWMSKQVIRRQTLMAQAAGTEPPPEDQVAWDFIAIYPPGAAWDDPFPIPSWYDGPVVDAIGPVEEALAR